MVNKLTCLYRGHIFEEIYGVVGDLCAEIADEPSPKNIQRLCGALSYASLFVIPDYDLIAGKAYTVENSCYYVDGIIKLSYHSIVDCFYKLTCGSSNIPDTLLKILLDCAFGEVMSVLRLPMRDIYVALLRCYCSAVKKEFTYNTEDNWYSLQLKLSEEVGYLAD